MKKFGMVLGAAAVAAIAGCKDLNYKRAGEPAGQNDAKSADTTVAKPAEQAAQPAAPQCTCAPGTRHTKPCGCGAANCACVVEPAPVQPAEPVDAGKKPAPAEPETTIYVVQSGDYLAKISKKFNVTIASIKKLNNMKSDVVRVGQKLKLPGKIDVGAAPAPVTVKKSSSFKPYSGATKEYVVKNGDTLGAIAYGNGINIRQLKELNGLKNDSLRVGQKIKVPAEKQAKAAAVKKAEKPAEKKAVAAAAPKVEEKPVQAEQAPAEDSKKPAEAAAPVVDQPAESAPVEAAAAPATTTYVVQEGDDMTGVSIRWGVSAADIRELNNLGDADQLKPGQILKLPAEAQQ